VDLEIEVATVRELSSKKDSEVSSKPKEIDGKVKLLEKKSVILQENLEHLDSLLASHKAQKISIENGILKSADTLLKEKAERTKLENELQFVDQNWAVVSKKVEFRKDHIMIYRQLIANIMEVKKDITWVRDENSELAASNLIVKIEGVMKGMRTASESIKS
jgi:hypothetical protein